MKTTRKKIKDTFSYKDGWLYWEKVSPYRPDRLGKKAGCKSAYGHGVLIRWENSLHRASRLIWAWHYGVIKRDLVIDHIDGNPYNNRIENLRAVPQWENCRNMKIPSHNKSGCIGVHKTGSKTSPWCAQIRAAKGTTKHLGWFSTFEKAKAARIEAEKLYGYHSNHGRI